MEFIANNLAPIMFAGLICFLLIGFPVAFSLGACGLFFAVIGIEMGVLPEALMQALPLRIYGVMQNETLLAIPFFTLMGLILERSGMAEDLLDTVGQLFGPIRGGVAIAVVIVGAMLAATTGVVAASGTLEQIIPPSLVLIILADQLGRSVGDLYKGAFLPGFMLVGLYMLLVFIIAFFRPSMVPALPPEARDLKDKNGNSGLPSLLVLTIICVGLSVFAAQNMEAIHTWITGEVVEHVAKDETIVFSMCFGVTLAFVAASINRITGLGLLSTVAEKVTFVLIPPLLLIFLVLGTIFLGIATPTEGGAMGAMGAIILAISRRRLNYKLLQQALVGTTKLSCFVVFILIGATMFSLTFQGVDGPLWVEHLLSDLPGGQLGFLILVNIMVFFLAFFLDFFELSFIIVPLLAPVADKLGVDLVWFGVLLAINMQTSFMHPPFGFALFYLRSVAPDKEYTDKVTRQRIAPVTTTQIYLGSIPFLCIQLMMVGLVIAFPGIVSSGLDEKVTYDLDAIREQMEANMPSAVDFENPFMTEDSASESAAPAEDDPLKAMQDALEAAPAN